MVVLEIRVMRKDKERAAKDVAAILSALKGEDADVSFSPTPKDSKSRGLRLAYSSD